ncbi:hypothetical protein SA2016_0837 [Sinomonas atrocyanea]|uniref:Uncharacterized protein n=1 Tax=Sinomonas atrocyanea TaxID=37927 RepID=A0A126ZYP8_9MICC|nr:hypothetical protein [Sinomonas atrocyanea]AMM31525.1 hypothetical protein SA2016_0837 [Sinomonas atrocyanea]GEB65091.1 hypothetical protein SAT01_25390 [Sinomonas atrocyanea]GGG63370.1 hypothetical protein GCM10007172_13280 [Sinomonas atrocyanea]
MSALNQRGDSESDPVLVPAAAIDLQKVSRPPAPMPVWVRLTFDDGSAERTQKGFALAWTDQHVQVQMLWEISYYHGARDFWVNADQVTRRAIDPQWLGCSG